VDRYVYFDSLTRCDVEGKTAYLGQATWRACQVSFLHLFCACQRPVETNRDEILCNHWPAKIRTQTCSQTGNYAWVPKAENLLVNDLIGALRLSFHTPRFIALRFEGTRINSTLLYPRPT
jgi:hypothetical protein